MYSYSVKDLLLASKPKDTSSDDDNDVSSDEILELILKQLQKQKDTPQRQYLMQCANWQESDFVKGKWIAYSPVRDRILDYGYWPLYSLDGLDVAANGYVGHIEFNSWKGDYDVEKRRMPEGNLPYRGERKNLVGTVWTRGE